MYLYHLCLKEYAGVWWTGFLILFFISSLPIVIMKFREKSVFYHQAYNLLFNIIVPFFFSTTAHYRTGNENFVTAFFIAFGIGYSILIFRKKKRDLFEKLLSTVFFIFYFCLFAFIIHGNMKYF